MILYVSTHLFWSQNPCFAFHFFLHPGNHGLSSSVLTSHPSFTNPLSTCSLSHFSSAGRATCSTCHVFLYCIRLFFPSFKIFAQSAGIYASSLNSSMGVNKALKLKTMAAERGRRRRVCQSTRRWMRWRERLGNWLRRWASEGWDGGMKSGVSISRPQEPRWMGREVGSLEK